jgi:hypothetical protein
LHHSGREQREVELYYINNGYLFPKYHLFYWIGLTTPQADPQEWRWIDPTAPKVSSTAYQHWGQGAAGNPPEMGAEPNNYMRDEKCGGANYTQSYDESWGWSDSQCGIKATFMCRLVGGCSLLLHTGLSMKRGVFLRSTSRCMLVLCRCAVACMSVNTLAKLLVAVPAPV